MTVLVPTDPPTLVVGAPTLDVLPYVPDGAVAAIVTSPPYYQRRRYTDSDDEIGTETSLDAYLDALVATFAAARRALADDGTCWVNIGDSASGTGGSGGDYREGGTYATRRRYRGTRAVTYRGRRIADGQWIDVPGKLAAALQDDGWRLRSMIVWNKLQVRREDPDHVRRPGEQTERVLMLAPSRGRYRYYPAEFVDPWDRPEPGDVWSFPGSSGTRGKAPFPDRLPARCLMLSTLPGDAVLDPFAGAGTTLRVAARHGRLGLGIDLDREAADPDDPTIRVVDADSVRGSQS